MPQLFTDSVAVFQSSLKSKDLDSFKSLIDAVDNNGDPVVVAIKPNVAMQQLNNANVNLQASVFPTTWKNIERWNKSGGLGYYDDKSPTASVVGSDPQEAAANADTPSGFDANIGLKAANVKVISKTDIEGMDSAQFKRGNSTENKHGFSIERAEKIADDLAVKYPNIPRVNLYENHNELPVNQKHIDEINNAISEQIKRIEEAKNDGEVMAALSVSLPEIQGAYLNGEIMINLDAIKSEDYFKRIYAHEGIGHLSVEAMLNEVDRELMPKLQNQVIRLNKMGNKYIRSIWQDVEENQPDLKDDIMASEVLAYIAERGDQNKEFTPVIRRMWQKIIDGIKAFAKLVFDVDMSDQDVRDIVSQAERYAKGEVNKSDLVSVYANGKTFFSKSPDNLPDTITVGGKERPTSDSEGNPIHSTLEGIKNFWEWFDGNDERRKGSVGTIKKWDDTGRNNGGNVAATRAKPYGISEDGSPRPFYHGTNVKIEEFEIGHDGQKDKGWLGRGLYLTSSPAFAKTYADRGLKNKLQ